LVSVGPLRYAIPSSSVEQILQFKPQALAAAYDEGSIEWQGGRVPAHYLGALVGIDDQPVAQHLSPIVIIRSGNLRLALHVDSVTRNQEVVVKNVGPQVARVPGIGGATVLGNGDIVLILNAARLAQAVLGDLWLDRPASATRQTRLAEVPRAVMVVDDSLTVRKATQRLLVREGYDVILAKDGVDAMRQLQDRLPDVMLVDIEMPRMDGFDLTRNVRADAKLRGIPIVMITSRTADKHRNYAMSLGVDVYLGKPYRDDELLGHVARLTGGPRTPDLKPAGRSLRPV
ncbi:MAG: response regulator, partial [Burkholderiaceae bacterium]